MFMAVQAGIRLSKGRSAHLIVFTPFHQQVDEDQTGKLDSAPQSEDLKPEETVSTEAGQETQKSGSPPLQDEEKVSDLHSFLSLESPEEVAVLSLRIEGKNVENVETGIQRHLCLILNQNCSDRLTSGARRATHKRDR